jgi:protein TonB
MLFIIGAHVAAVAVAMSVKMAIDQRAPDKPLIINPIPLPEPPPPIPQPEPKTIKPPMRSTIDQTRPIIPTPTPMEPVDLTPMPTPLLGTLAGSSIIPEPRPQPTEPLTLPVRKGPRLATPDWALKPPYPSSKLDSQEETSLRLQLSIDARGRVIAVDPVGRADAAFLAAARRHLIAKWRYLPATVDGRPVATSTVITLRFELEG